MVKTNSFSIVNAIGDLKNPETPADRIIEILMALGAQLEPMPQVWHHRSSRVSGCQATVYLYLRSYQSCQLFTGFSDSQLIRGLLLMLMYDHSGKPSRHLQNLDASMILQPNLSRYLGTARSNGLKAIIDHIKLLSHQTPFLLKHPSFNDKLLEKLLPPSTRTVFQGHVTSTNPDRSFSSDPYNDLLPCKSITMINSGIHYPFQIEHRLWHYDREGNQKLGAVLTSLMYSDHMKPKS